MHHIRFLDPADDVRRGEYDPATDLISAHPTYGSRITLDDEEFTPEEIEVLPPCDPSKIVCVGLNYADHAAEQGSDIPDRPLLFIKTPNTVAAHNDTVDLLPGKERIDHEAELGVIISDRARHVSAKHAMDYVAGYTCVNDISNRDDQDREVNWVRGKAFDNSAPIGPVVATPEEVPDDASIELRVNGETRQSSSIDKFIFSIPELIEEITSYMTLEPGDVISTGTPAGVSPLADGDKVEVDIEGIATLRHHVHIP
jgi:2-keto-4-pentenoate hydratase/2-oxohepta-3-ene-1,7-dioic acid hydratase in catechol pathway